MGAIAPFSPLIGAAGGVLGNMISSSGQQSSNAANIQAMMQNEQWQTQMSDTQMQRRVADLKAAGLNPLLAVNTPGASMGSPTMPNVQNPNAAYGQLGNQVTNALQTATQTAQIANLNADTKQKAAMTPGSRGPQTDDQVTVQNLNDWQRQVANNADAAAAQVGINQKQIEQLDAAIDNLKAQLPGLQATSTSAQSQAAVSAKMASLQVTAQDIANTLSQSKEPEAQAVAKLFQNLGQAGTGQAQGMYKMALTALIALFSK